MQAELVAGPELDERVCRALGIGGKEFAWDPVSGKPLGLLWTPVSTEPGAMWRVVEALQAWGWDLHLAWIYQRDLWEATFSEHEMREVTVTAPTVALALCLAALEALETMEETNPDA